MNKRLMAQKARQALRRAGLPAARLVSGGPCKGGKPPVFKPGWRVEISADNRLVVLMDAWQDPKVWRELVNHARYGVSQGPFIDKEMSERIALLDRAAAIYADALQQANLQTIIYSSNKTLLPISHVEIVGEEVSKTTKPTLTAEDRALLAELRTTYLSLRDAAIEQSRTPHLGRANALLRAANLIVERAVDRANLEENSA